MWLYNIFNYPILLLDYYKYLIMFEIKIYYIIKDRKNINYMYNDNKKFVKIFYITSFFNQFF